MAFQRQKMWTFLWNGAEVHSPSLVGGMHPPSTLNPDLNGPPVPTPPPFSLSCHVLGQGASRRCGSMMPHVQYRFGLQARFSICPAFHSPEPGLQNTLVRRQALKALDNVQRAHCGGKLRLGAGEPSSRQAAAFQGAWVWDDTCERAGSCLGLNLALWCHQGLPACSQVMRSLGTWRHAGGG